VVVVVLKFMEDLQTNSEDEESGYCVFVAEIIVNLTLILDS